MRDSLQVVALAVALVASLGTQLQAQASDDDRARTHFEAGRSYYEQARYDDAAREFQEAFNLSGRAALLLNSSQAYERGLHFDQAIAALQQYLQLTPNAPDRKTLEERISHLQELQTRVQSQPAGQSPAPAPGAPAPQADGAPAAPAAATTPTQSEKHSLRVPGWVLVGSGGALLVGSLVTGLIAHGKHEDLAKACDKAGMCPSASQSDIDSGKTLSVVSTVLTVLGVVAGGVGATLLVIDAGDKRQDTPPPTNTAHARLTGGPTPLSLGAEVVF